MLSKLFWAFIALLDKQAIIGQSSRKCNLSASYVCFVWGSFCYGVGDSESHNQNIPQKNNMVHSFPSIPDENHAKSAKPTGFGSDSIRRQFCGAHSQKPLSKQRWLNTCAFWQLFFSLF